MSETQIVWLQLNPKQKFYEYITLESGANLPFSHYNFQIETYRIFNKKTTTQDPTYLHSVVWSACGWKFWKQVKPWVESTGWIGQYQYCSSEIIANLSIQLSCDLKHFSLSPVHHSSSWSCALCTCCSGLSGSSGVPAIGGICCGSSSGSAPSSSLACWKKLCFTQNTRASVTKETMVGLFLYICLSVK